MVALHCVSSAKLKLDFSECLCSFSNSSVFLYEQVGVKRNLHETGEAEVLIVTFVLFSSAAAAPRTALGPSFSGFCTHVHCFGAKTTSFPYRSPASPKVKVCRRRDTDMGSSLCLLDSYLSLLCPLPGHLPSQLLPSGSATDPKQRRNFNHSPQLHLVNTSALNPSFNIPHSGSESLTLP